MLLETGLFLIFMLMGAIGWLIERRAQKNAGQAVLPIRPPRWVVRLCGNPRGDGTIELASGAKQLLALLFLLATPLCFVLPLSLSVRMGLLFLIYAMVALPITVLVDRLHWQAGEGPEAQAKGREPSLEGPNVR